MTESQIEGQWWEQEGKVAYLPLAVDHPGWTKATEQRAKDLIKQERKMWAPLGYIGSNEAQEIARQHGLFHHSYYALRALTE